MDNKEVKELEDFIDRRIGDSDRRTKSLMERWATPTSLSLLVGVIIWAITLQASVKEHEGKLEVLEQFSVKTEDRHDTTTIQLERVVLLLDQIERRVIENQERLSLHVSDHTAWKERIITLEQRGNRNEK